MAFGRMVTTVLALLAAVPALAETRESNLVSVMPIAGRGAVEDVDREVFEDLVRDEASRYLVPAGFLVLARDTQLRVLEDNGISPDMVAKACESSCPLATAKELNVRMFIAGHVSRTSDGELVAQLRMFDGTTGAILASVRPLAARSHADLRAGFSREARAFFAAVLASLGARPEPVVEGGKKAPPPGAGLGSVLVKSIPAGARVRVDGESKGETPVVVDEVLPGDHPVEIELDRYEVWKDSVAVTGGATARVDARLVPLQGRVRLSNRVSAAVACRVGDREATVDGGDVAEVVLPEGRFDVRCTAEGHLPFESSVSVRHKQAATVAVAPEIRRLTPEQEAAAARQRRNRAARIPRVVLGTLISGGGLVAALLGRGTFATTYEHSPVTTVIGAGFTLAGPLFGIWAGSSSWGETFHAWEPALFSMETVLSALMGILGPGYLALNSIGEEGGTGDRWGYLAVGNAVLSVGLAYLVAAMGYDGYAGSGGDVWLAPALRPGDAPAVGFSYRLAF